MRREHRTIEDETGETLDEQETLSPHDGRLACLPFICVHSPPPSLMRSSEQ